MLEKRYRLSPKKDFDRVYNQGNKEKGEFGMLIGLEEKELKNTQFGIVVGKKVGKANRRNKIKRRIRYIIQNLLNEDFFENSKLKIVYIAFKEPEDFESLKKELLEQFRKLLKK
jgi:ribonuclease P protein component